jgi:predicted aspartyl protease
MRSARWSLLIFMAAITASPAIAKKHALADATPACSLATKARARALLSVPFRVVDGRIYVTAKVDGQGDFIFAVDTGASGMGRADASLVAALNLPVTGTSQTSDSITVADVKTVRLSSVDLGGFVRRDIEVITRDYTSKMAREASFSGIIGRDFFGDGLLVIDYPAKQLTFTRAIALKGNERNVLSYERPFRVPVEIGGTLTEGNLDTGANVSFVLPKALFDRVGGGQITTASEGKLTNTTISTGRATVKGPIRIGAASMADVEVRVSDRFPELLVGAHALQNLILIIDQRSKKIMLCR